MRPHSQRLKIALFGNFGTGNLGNEATLQAMLGNLRRLAPTAEIFCICSGPENVTAHYGISAFPIRASFPYRQILGRVKRALGIEPSQAPGSHTEAGEPSSRRKRGSLSKLASSLRTLFYALLAPYRWFKAISRLRRADLLIMTGTGMLGDFGIRPFTLHYDILTWSIAARLCRCKLLFVSVGAGPIRDPLSRRFVKASLSLAHYRSYRDDFSKTYLQRIGFDVRHDFVCPDLAFSLPIEKGRPRPSLDRRAPVIGVGLMNYHDRLGMAGQDDTVYQGYLRKMADFVIRLLEHQCTVRLLIGDIVYDNPVRQDLKKILKKRGVETEDERIVDEPATSVDELLAQLASTDIVASSRFHNVLLALMLGKPVFAISYSEKFQPLLRGVGLEEFCQDIESIDIDLLAAKIGMLQDRALHLERQILGQAELFRRALDEQYMKILRLSGADDTIRGAAQNLSMERSAPL